MGIHLVDSLFPSNPIVLFPHNCLKNKKLDYKLIWMPHPISIYISGCTFHKWSSEWARHKIHGWECADGSLGMMGMMSAPMSWLGWLLAQNQRKIWCCAVYVILVQASYPSPNLPYPSESDMASCFYRWYVSEWI